jgi:ribosome-binding factor A
MPSYRPKRVAEMVHKEVSHRLRVEIKDPRISSISITNVEVSRDLQGAVISYLPLGGGVPSEELLAGLSDAARRLRGPIGRALRLRRAPNLHFVYDSNFEDAIRVSNLLDRLGAERNESTAGEE